MGKQARNPYEEIASIQKAAIERGLGQLESGTGQVQDTIQGGIDSATGALDPYAQAGEDSLSFFNALTGVSGDPEEALQRYESSPFAKIIQQQLGDAQQATARQFSAMNQTQSGNFASALQDVTAQKTQEGLLGFSGLLQDNINRGQQAATTQGGILFSGAQNLAGIQQGLVDARSDAEISKGAAEAGAIANSLSGGLFDAYGSRPSGISDLKFGE